MCACICVCVCMCVRICVYLLCVKFASEEFTTDGMCANFVFEYCTSQNFQSLSCVSKQITHSLINPKWIYQSTRYHDLMNVSFIQLNKSKRVNNHTNKNQPSNKPNKQKTRSFRIWPENKSSIMTTHIGAHCLNSSREFSKHQKQLHQLICKASHFSHQDGRQMNMSEIEQKRQLPQAKSAHTEKNKSSFSTLSPPPQPSPLPKSIGVWSH